MWTRFFNFWEKLRSNYWFLPSLMALGALALAAAAIWFDERYSSKWLWESGWAYRNEPEGARELLSTIASGNITVAGVVFSITIVALSLASQQFGPRLIYNFMRDRGNQFVLGTFIATYVYSLLVLRTIRQGDETFVPHLSIFVGFLLALLSLGVLIFFIHHVADSIQAMTVIASVHEDLQKLIASLFPAPYESRVPWLSGATGAEIPDDFGSRAVAVRAPRSGYLQAVDLDGLLELAGKKNLLIRLEHRPGHYVIKGCVIARVLPFAEDDRGEWETPVGEALLLGRKRTQEQDVEFLLDELVEIAVRALSPGINDPHTAVTCIDRIGSALAELAGRAIPSPFRHDSRGRLRLVTRPHSYPGLVDASLDQIRQYGLGSVAVTIRLLEMIGAVLSFTRDETQREALLRQAAMIKEGGMRAFPEELDRRQITERYNVLFTILQKMCGVAGCQ